jgi:twitching motility two-component system response regulator PilG
VRTLLRNRRSTIASLRDALRSNLARRPGRRSIEPARKRVVRSNVRDEEKWQRRRAPNEESRMENLATNTTHRLAGLKVLVIDDSKTIRRTAETLLSKEGCEVYTAVDGFDALSKIADHQPDIVFVDIMMPRLDGYQTCSLIKHNKVFRSIPVIMLSSKDGLFDRARGRIVGSEHYLTKPFTKDELLNAIETHVGAR